MNRRNRQKWQLVGARPDAGLAGVRRARGTHSRNRLTGDAAAFWAPTAAAERETEREKGEDQWSVC